MDIKDFVVPLAELRHACDPAEFPFATTEELKPREEVIGQARAVSAIEFGLSIRNHGYNIFVSGVPGTGRNTIVKSIVKRISLDRPVPEDWCYINNFKDPDRPLAVKLAPGSGRELQQDMEKFIELMLSGHPQGLRVQGVRGAGRRPASRRSLSAPRRSSSRTRAARRRKWAFSSR